MILSIITFIEILICYLLQSSVFPHLSMANVVPDLLMILIIANAYHRGVFAGMLTGFISGLMVDCATGSIIGLYAFSYMLVGFLAGYSNKIYDRDDYVIPMVLIALGEFLYCFITYIFEFLLRGKLYFGYYMLRISMPRVIYTVFVGIILYKCFHMILNGLTRLTKKEEV